MVIRDRISSNATPEQLKRLVDVFQNFNFDRPCRPCLEQFRSPAIVFTRTYWEAVRERFSVPETIVLAQALTVLEREFKWMGGPGAAAIWIVKDLLDRQPDAGELLAGWIAQQTRNGYLQLACDRRPAVRVWVADLSAPSPED